MSEQLLSQPTRQEIRGFVLILLFEAVQKIRLLWPALLPFFFNEKFKAAGYLPWVLLGILVLLVVHVVLFYLNFSYWVADAQFILKKGYIKRKVLHIPLERIQNVSANQNLLQRLFRIYTVEVDTAGSAQKELKIYSVNEEQLKALRHFLQEGPQVQPVETSEQETKEASSEEKQTASSPILQLSPLDLLKIGVSQNHLRTGFIVAAVIYNFFYQVEEVAQEQTERLAAEVSGLIGSSGLWYWVILILFFVVLSFVSSLVITVVKYYELKLTKSPSAYEIKSGLFTRREVQIPLTKIQQINWQTNPFQKLFGIHKLRLKQAASIESIKSSVTDIPGVLEKHTALIRVSVFGEQDFASCPKVATDPRYFRVLWSFGGLLPAIAPLYFYIQDPSLLLWPALWLVGTFVYFKLMVRKRYFRCTPSQLLINKGAIGTEWQQFELFKTQSVEYRQSIFQKRLNLASLKIYNASGSLSIPYIPVDQADALHAYLLEHVEQSFESWM